MSNSNYALHDPLGFLMGVGKPKRKDLPHHHGTVSPEQYESIAGLGGAQPLAKAHVKAHTRRTKSGKVVPVAEHEDKRTAADLAQSGREQDAARQVDGSKLAGQLRDHAGDLRRRAFEHEDKRDPAKRPADYDLKQQHRADEIDGEAARTRADDEAANGGGQRGHAIHYRSGGTANYKWHKVLSHYETPEDAQAKRAEIERMGYPTILAGAGDALPNEFAPAELDDWSHAELRRKPLKKSLAAPGQARSALDLLGFDHEHAVAPLAKAMAVPAGTDPLTAKDVLEAAGMLPFDQMAETAPFRKALTAAQLPAADQPRGPLVSGTKKTCHHCGAKGDGPKWRKHKHATKGTLDFCSPEHRKEWRSGKANSTEKM